MREANEGAEVRWDRGGHCYIPILQKRVEFHQMTTLMKQDEADCPVDEKEEAWAPKGDEGWKERGTNKSDGGW